MQQYNTYRLLRREPGHDVSLDLLFLFLQRLLLGRAGGLDLALPPRAYELPIIIFSCIMRTVPYRCYRAGL